jgi:hypothetical protein
MLENLGTHIPISSIRVRQLFNQVTSEDMSWRRLVAIQAVVYSALNAPVYLLQIPFKGLICSLTHASNSLFFSIGLTLRIIASFSKAYPLYIPPEKKDSAVAEPLRDPKVIVELFSELPKDIITREIGGKLGGLDVLKCCLVSKLWNEYFAHLAHPVRSCLQEAVFGKGKWNIHHGDIGRAPPLPNDLYEILQGPCPINPEKLFRETHIGPFLIPATVNGEPYKLDLLGKLIQAPKQGPATKFECCFLGEYQDVPVDESYWVCIPRSVLDGSLNEDDAAHSIRIDTLAQSTGISYIRSKIIEVVTCFLMHYVSTGERLLSDNPWRFTRCQEFYDKVRGWSIVVGGFGLGGLRVGNGCCCDELGVVPLRKF